jgi:hypothetical protein
LKENLKKELENYQDFIKSQAPYFSNKHEVHFENHKSEDKKIKYYELLF